MTETITRDELRQAIDDGDVPVVETLRAEQPECRNPEIVADQLAAPGYTNVRRYAAGKQDRQDAGLRLDLPAEARP